MKPKPEKPRVLGITPVGLGFLGFLVMLVVATSLTNLFAWITRWLGL